MQNTTSLYIPPQLAHLRIHTITVADARMPYPTLLLSDGVWYAFSLDGQFIPIRAGEPLDAAHPLVVAELYEVGTTPVSEVDVIEFAITASHLLNGTDYSYGEVLQMLASNHQVQHSQ